MQAPKDLDRDELVVCTKAGYLVRGAVPETLRPENVVGGMHSMAPEFLADQLERSRLNLGLETIDVFYLHNPETQFGFVDPEEFYGTTELRSSSWSPPYPRERFNTTVQRHGKDSANRTRCPSFAWKLWHARSPAQAIISDSFNCRTISQWRKPFRHAMSRRRNRMHRARSRARSRRHRRRECQYPAGEAREGPSGAGANIGSRLFHRRAACDSVLASAPGITTSLVGMGSVRHVEENLGIAAVPPLAPEQYQTLFRMRA